MSRTVRIALVAEGVTDYEVLKAAIESMLNGQSFDMKLLQPEGSVAFTGAGSAGALGGVRLRRRAPQGRAAIVTRALSSRTA
jgi:hypothetical protein